ncbi:Uncharacterised protein [Vibrio cholerae]|jgi:hypothetical protein|nr:hypothetical protein AVO52_10980 [Vibrio cholerae]CRZ45121.1 Uncharacterised protein [Vibrio cholerae]CRZ62423.1 Uncharacterised protein [Vibrio cholerae]CRZ63251.1 Uncharacterised protein [Vibrio cholerae]CRZ64950.1 Uncharacterised protein [Vibrio cholerae]
MRSATVPPGPTSGNNCFAIDAPDWMVIIAASKLRIAMSKGDFIVGINNEKLSRKCEEIMP